VKVVECLCEFDQWGGNWKSAQGFKSIHLYNQDHSDCSWTSCLSISDRSRSSFIKVVVESCRIFIFMWVRSMERKKSAQGRKPSHIYNQNHLNSSRTSCLPVSDRSKSSFIKVVVESCQIVIWVRSMGRKKSAQGRKSSHLYNQNHLDYRRYS
jgi:hypothetical protein